MALAAVHSKAVVLHSVVNSVFIASPDVCGRGGVVSGPYFVVWYLVFFLCYVAFPDHTHVLCLLTSFSLLINRI